LLSIVAFLMTSIIFIYGAFSTIFHDTALIGHIGRLIGEWNIKIFGYIAYIDFLILMLPLYLFYTKPSYMKRLESIVGWILLFISLILLQAMTVNISHSGLAGIAIYQTLYPMIGKAGLWLFWLLIFSISLILTIEEFPDIDLILYRLSNLKEKIVSLIEKLTQYRQKEIKEEKKKKNSFTDILYDIFNSLKYLLNPAKRKEEEDILKMKLDPLSMEFTDRGERDYRSFLKKDIERIENIAESNSEDIEDDEDDIDREIEDLLVERPIKEVIDDKEDIEEIPTVVEKPKKRKKVTIVEELEENKKLLESIDKGKVDKPKYFKLPKLDFLHKPPKNRHRINEAEIDRKIGELLDKLSKFKIEGDVIRTYSGPLVTTFEFKPAPNVKVSKILGLQDDLAMALKAETIRIQAPIPGKDVVGIEIPNDKFDTIYLRDVLESDLFKRSKSPLTVALGKDIVGNPFITDLKKLPHLLIAGTTGSGKSVGINAMLISLLYRNDPDRLKLIMIDPKMLEFSIYNDIPHLLTPVITEPQKAIAALANVVGEMERRYRLMSENKVKNIDNFNSKMKKEGKEELPYIIVVIDELADLMMTGGKEVEYSIARLAQMARAAGIHLIVATQRPSVDVVTGLIKANLPSRLSYRVGQKIDSKVILDQMGAESLLGRGDALFTPPGATGLVRIHAPWNTEEEIEKIVEFLKAQRLPEYDESFLQSGDDSSEIGINNSGALELDPLFEQAKEVVLTDRKTSISYLQRKLQIGYNRSANIIDQLEKMGILSAPNNKGQREIIV